MGGKSLPYDAEIDYLQSTGTAYINTGITPTLSYSVEMEFKWVSPWSTTDAAGTLFGALNGWNTNTFMVVCTASNNNRYIYNCWGNNSNYNSNANYINGLLDNWHSLTFRNKTTYIDGTAIAGAASGTGNPIGNIYVFCTNFKNTGTYGRGTTKQIRSFKLYNASSELVMDLIPVRKGTTGYMYDKISKKLFGNAGTDAFVLGPDKSTLPYDAEVEYLQGDGAAYIDTGVNFQSSQTVTEIKVVVPSIPSSTSILWGAFMDNNPKRPSVQVGVRSEGKWHITSAYSQDMSVSGASHLGNITLNTLYTITVAYSAQSDGTNATAYIFARNNDTGAYLPSNVRIYGLKITKGNTLVRDFIPVRKDGAGYMYDKVSGELFGNAGTGSFTLGPDKT